MSRAKTGTKGKKGNPGDNGGGSAPAAPGGDAGDLHVEARLRSLRQRCHLSMRGLAEKAGVSVGYVSGVESGAISPTIATLRKLLLAMGTDIGTFFQEKAEAEPGPVFRREEMVFVNDGGRNYTLVLPQREDVESIILDEEFMPDEKSPVMETLPGDLAGYVIKGEVLLEVEGEEPQVLRTGDAYYVKAGRQVRGHAWGDEPARLITVQGTAHRAKTKP